MTLRSTSRRNVRVGHAKLKCFTPFRNRHSADAPEAGHVKVHSRRSQVIQGKRSFSETCIRMLRRPGKDVVQLMPNNSGESTANHGWIIPIQKYSHETRAVYIEIREDPIRLDRDLGKNHARRRLVLGSNQIRQLCRILQWIQQQRNRSLRGPCGQRNLSRRHQYQPDRAAVSTRTASSGRIPRSRAPDA